MHVYRDGPGPVVVGKGTRGLLLHQVVIAREFIS